VTVAIAILAAGRGSRLGGDDAKPLALLHDRPLVAWALDAAMASGLRPVWLVTGYAGRKVAAAAPAGVDVAHNRRWRRGIASSLRVALAAIAPYAQVDAVCIGLADQPRVGPEAYRRLSAAHKLEGDVGARQLMQRHDVVEVRCDDTGSAVDVDTPQDLEQLNEETQ